MGLGLFIPGLLLGVLHRMIVMICMLAIGQSGQRSRQLVIVAVAHSVHLGRPVYFARLVTSGPIILLSATQLSLMRSNRSHYSGLHGRAK
jgi:hypothetical protein